MKVYLEEKDIGRRITTYHDGLGTQQGLYVFGKDKIEVHSLADYTKQVRREVCEDIRKWCAKNFNWVGDGTGYDGQDYNEMIGANNTINKLRNFLDQIQGEKE
jgi:hypothetical protein